MLNSLPLPPRAWRWRTRKGEGAKAMPNPDMRRPIQNTARRFAQLAVRLDTARSSSTAADNTASSTRRVGTALHAATKRF